MELSLQSNKNYLAMFRTRQMMITKEKLRINNKIDYNGFLELFRKYGKGITEKDFAKYFLDIPTLKHYYLQSGKTKLTPILLREFISTSEIAKIRSVVEEIIKKEGIKKIGYDFVEYLYESYGGKLDIATFGEEVLGITHHSVEILKSDPKQKATLYLISANDKAQIRKIQNQIIIREGLHIDDTITLEEFQNLYNAYGNGIPEKDFAIQVLQIPSARYNRLKAGKNAYTTILSRYLFNPEEILKLREKVILKEGLHIDDLIDYQRFQELHRKHGGPLSEEMFAEEILDISAIGVKNMRVAGTKSAILTNIDVPEDFILELRKKVATENSLRQNQLITLDEINELYEKYGGVLSQRQFVTLVLDIPSVNYNSLVCGTNKSVTMLRDYNADRFISLRRRIISEERLHYDEAMDYQTFLRIHQKYASKENPTVFAEKVLDIPEQIFYNLKYGTSKKINILKKEQLPSQKELEGLKFRVALENGLHIKDKINYTAFKKIYNRYSGILPEYLFAENILDISKSSFAKIRNDMSAEVTILANAEMSEKEIKKLRSEVIIENSLYPGKAITLKQFKRLHKSYEGIHILSESLFANLILGIKKQSLNKLKRRSCKTIRILLDSVQKKRSRFLSDDEVKQVREFLISGFDNEQIAAELGVTMPYLKKNIEYLFRYERLSEAEINAERRKRRIKPKAKKIKPGDIRKEEIKSREKRLKDGEVLRKTKTRIINDFELTEEDILKVKEYIANCAERFLNDEFPQEEIPDLQESLTFVGCGEKEIKMFSRICISFGLYKIASSFISNNIDNRGITENQKGKLRIIQSSINYATRKSEVVRLFSEGVTDTKYISQRAGVSETEVIQIQRRISSDEEPIVKEPIERLFDE